MMAVEMEANLTYLAYTKLVRISIPCRDQGVDHELISRHRPAKCSESLNRSGFDLYMSRDDHVAYHQASKSGTLSSKGEPSLS